MVGIGGKLTTIIPNFNGEAEIAGCLASVLREAPASSIIVVDDGSTDGSLDLIKHRFPEVRVIQFEENRGFAHAVNAGILAAETPYVFLLNNDARVTPGALQRLLGAMEETGRNTFSVQAKMLTRSKPRRIDSCGDLYCALGWAFSPGLGADEGQYCRRTELTSTCAGAALYRRELLIRVGMFDEAHFCYLEDVDLGIRARLAGYRNLYEPTAVVLHSGSASSGGKRHSDFKVRLAAGNNLYLLYKNFPPVVLAILSPLLAAGMVIKGVYFCRKGLGTAYIGGLAEGCRKILDGADRRVRPANPRELRALIRLTAELYVNLIRRVVG
ncbi:MAG: glycosyltransferase family 2 protein [Lachnospiraceae bacterium]|nr:glycosyltransferase family 2 protein [Lachnospiraceae bacterium]